MDKFEVECVRRVKRVWVLINLMLNTKSFFACILTKFLLSRIFSDFGDSGQCRLLIFSTTISFLRFSSSISTSTQAFFFI